MNFVLDASGGDNAPSAMVQGALAALPLTPNDLNFILIGNEDHILKEFGDKIPDRLSIVNAEQKIDMHDSGATVIKTKPDSAIVRGIRLVKTGEADAFISAGHTGAVMTASTLLLGRIPNVKRPALGAYIPSESGGKSNLRCWS